MMCSSTSRAAKTRVKPGGGSVCKGGGVGNGVVTGCATLWGGVTANRVQHLGGGGKLLTEFTCLTRPYFPPGLNVTIH